MRVKLYKARLTTRITLAKNKPYEEWYFASIMDDSVRIKDFNFWQKLIARSILVEEPAMKEEIEENIAEYETVKQYKKEYLKNFNTYCCKVDEELSQIGK